jgi:hypothetical protein
MTSWFRSWHGAPTDNKWLLIASRAKVKPGIVSAVAWALFDHASQAEDRGSVKEFDTETYAVFSGFGENEVQAVIAAMCAKGVIDGDGRLSAWDKRQPKREDDSAERVREWRKRKSVTSEDVTQCNAEKRNVTPANDTDTDTDTESDTEKNPLAGARGVKGFDSKYGSRQARAAYHTVEAQKLGVDAETFRALVDKLIDAAKLRTLIEQGQNERKLTDAKDAALELVRMAVTTPAQVDTLIEAYRAANDWRKTPPTPQALSEYASQIADKLKPKPKKTFWVLDSNGNRMHEAQL